MTWPLLDFIRRWSGASRPTAPAPLPDPKLLGETIVLIAISEIGHGEAGANNRGRDLERYFGRKETAEWCAAFAGWCYAQAYRKLDAALPFERSFGAKKLLRQVGALGHRFDDPALARPGDLVAWHRGAQGSWSGHIGIVAGVDNGIIHTIEGNVGPFPARVRRLVHDVRKERLYGFATVRPPEALSKP